MSQILNTLFQPRYATLALAGVGLISYSLYFDHWRRSQPDYKKKIRENRKRKQEDAIKRSSPAHVDFPSPLDPIARQNFFYGQISTGEELLTAGDHELGLIHLANAIVTCEHPQELLGIFSQTLPAEHFEGLIHELPAAKMRQKASAEKFFGNVPIIGKPEVSSGDNEMLKLLDDEEGLNNAIIVDNELE